MATIQHFSTSEIDEILSELETNSNSTFLDSFTEEELINILARLDLTESQMNHICLLAIQHNNFLIFELMINRGADIDSEKGKMLIEACHYNRLSLVKYLLHRGVNICQGVNLALMTACRCGYSEIVRLLVDVGTIDQKANIFDQQEKAIYIANEYHHLHIVQFLQQRGSQLYRYQHDLEMRLCEKGEFY
jgi:ankyrin repeat protein